MDHIGDALVAANNAFAQHESALVARSGGISANGNRPPVYKAIGIALAIGSGAFIGTSFVLKKYGLLKANEKYHEAAGEGYGYLKNVWWWSGMTLMIMGEICNFVAYAFTDAILVTPLGALSVVITTVLSAIFLKERLSMVGKVSCFLCIVGAVIIVMNAPASSSVANIQEMKKFVLAPGFLAYTGVLVVGSIITAFYAGPRWGKKNMLVYISICSWIGGLSVVATQGLGAAIVAQAGNPAQSQFKEWFLYVLLVFVMTTLITEIIFLNKALNLFNAAMVTPTYYVYFTSTTIITSAVLFQGFKGTPTAIITVVLGFLTICSGVVLLQLSKSAKDVPDTAVFAGNLNQIQTIAEQEQPETEPKADAIRGTAALLRRISQTRMKMEAEELRRLHQEKMQSLLDPVHEDQVQYEWDGLRRRRTMTMSPRPTTGPQPAVALRPRNASTFSEPQQPAHPPLGMSRFPTDEEIAVDSMRGRSNSLISSIAGTIRGRGRTSTPDHLPRIQSPLHPVQLSEIVVPTEGSSDGTQVTSPEPLLKQRRGTGSSPPNSARRQFSFQNMFRRHHPADTWDSQTLPTSRPSRLHQQQTAYPPSSHHPEEASSTPMIKRPPLGQGVAASETAARRAYSTPRENGGTEEEQLGLVRGDSAGDLKSAAAIHDAETSDSYSLPLGDASQGSDADYSLGNTPRAAAVSSGSPKKKQLKRDQMTIYTVDDQADEKRSRPPPKG